MSHMSQEFAPVSREHGRMSLESLHGLDRLASDDAALFSPPAGLCMCVRGGVGGLGRWLWAGGCECGCGYECVCV